MRNYFSKIEALRIILEKNTTPESNGLFWGLKQPENGRNFFHSFLTYVCIQNLHFAKKTFKNDHTGPQQWSEEDNAMYMGSPPPIWRWTQRANDRYKDLLDGQLTSHLRSNSGVLDPFGVSGGLWSQIWGQFLAIFWPSLIAPADLVKFLLFKMTCTGVPPKHRNCHIWHLFQ